MRQYTTPEQTAKLIELGFEKPRIDAGVTKWEGYEPICTGSYTLGELIEMLPPRAQSVGSDWDLEINHDYRFEQWLCCFNPVTQFGVATELVDALYNLIINLKEEGVI